MNAPVQLVVATYNVHSCVGTDGRFDPSRCADVIGEMQPHVVALQEVDTRATRGRPPLDQFDYFATRTAMRAVSGAVLSTPRGGRYGNALLTSLELLSVETLDLTVGRREPRGAIDAVVLAGGARMRIVATHLGLGGGERRAQLARIAQHLDREPALPTLLLGDLNEWRPGRWRVAPIAKRLARAPAGASFPSRRRLFAIDQIWVRPGAAVLSSGVHSSPLSRVASDHLPVRASLDVSLLVEASARSERT